ncbi:MAG: hypothetical protein K5981_04515 [Clostridia bacterium]|nr:hypothetical protein [Clostridia bacterium]
MISLAAAGSFAFAAGFRTCVTDADGATVWYDGALDPADPSCADCFEEAVSYGLYDGGTCVLTVEFREAAPGEGLLMGTSLLNGYYAASFDLDSSCRAFITGLSGSNVSAVQSELIRCRKAGEQFDMTNISFIDAEKMDPTRGGIGTDSDLCWAAAASNALYYTGWAAQTEYGFDSPDRVFELLVNYFSDGGGSSECAISWFFSGINPTQNVPGFAYVDTGDYGDLWGLLNDYCPGVFTRRIYMMERGSEKNCCPNIVPVLADLRKGAGVVMSVDWYDMHGSGSSATYSREGGHSITLWGYVQKKGYGAFDPSDYTALLFTDSDSDKYSCGSRGEAWSAANRLQYSDLAYVGFRSEDDGIDHTTWQLTGYEGTIGLLDSFAILQPYSASAPREDMSAVSYDRFSSKSVDAAAVLSIEDSNGLQRTVFRAPDNGEAYVRLSAGIGNELADWSEAREVAVDVSITGSDGQKVFSQGYRDAQRIDNNCILYWTEDLDLPGGTYTATACVSLADGSREAFLTNNTKSITFTVVDAAQRRFSVPIRAVEDGTITVDLDCREDFEYPIAGVTYLVDGAWEKWTWDAYLTEALPVQSKTVEAKKADWMSFCVYGRNEWENYTVTSELLQTSCTLTLDADLGSLEQTEHKAYLGFAYDLPQPAAPKGYRFAGWREEDGRAVSSAEICTEAKDRTLTAQWESSCSVKGEKTEGGLHVSIANPDGVSALMLLAGYDADGRMLFLLPFSGAEADGFAAAPEAENYKLFLTGYPSLAPLCPAGP